VFKRAKAFHASNRAATVTGLCIFYSAEKNALCGGHSYSSTSNPVSGPNQVARFFALPYERPLLKFDGKFQFPSIVTNNELNFIWDYVRSGLCPSFGILKNAKEHAGFHGFGLLARLVG
jgi:hypothetical protein